MQIVELERLDQVAVPDQAAVGDVDVGHPLIDLRRSWPTPSASVRSVRNTRAVGLHHALHVEADLGGRAAALGVAELVEPGEREVGARPWAAASWIAPGLTTSPRRRPAARPNTTRSIRLLEPRRLAPWTRDAGRLADREQAGHDRVRIAVLQRHDLAVIVGRDAAHRCSGPSARPGSAGGSGRRRRRSSPVSVMPGSRSCRIFGSIWSR